MLTPFPACPSPLISISHRSSEGVHYRRVYFSPPFISLSGGMEPNMEHDTSFLGELLLMEKTNARSLRRHNCSTRAIIDSYAFLMAIYRDNLHEAHSPKHLFKLICYPH